MLLSQALRTHFLVGRCTLPRATNRRCRFAGEHLLDVGFDDIGFRYVHNISHVRLKDQPESAFNSIVQGKRERPPHVPKTCWVSTRMWLRSAAVDDNRACFLLMVPYIMGQGFICLCVLCLETTGVSGSINTGKMRPTGVQVCRVKRERQRERERDGERERERERESERERERDRQTRPGQARPDQTRPGRSGLLVC